jgi:hypothetical protein
MKAIITMRTILIGDSFYEVCPRCGAHLKPCSVHEDLPCHRRWGSKLPLGGKCVALCGMGLCDVSL